MCSGVSGTVSGEAEIRSAPQQRPGLTTTGRDNIFDSVRTTALDGSTIEYEVRGDGPTVVLVHGITQIAPCMGSTRSRACS